MRATVSSAALFLTAATAQAGGVWVEVLSPADVDVPLAVQRVAVIDRSAPANAGQVAYSVVEGLLTGEGPEGDRVDARDAVAAMVAELEASPRFEVVTRRVTCSGSSCAAAPPPGGCTTPDGARSWTARSS